MTSPTTPDPAPGAGTTRDGFLGGRLVLEQPARGYRAGVDPVLLAAAVPARPGQAVLELGCGVGAASLCLGARVGGLALTGVELQPAYAALARRNAVANGIGMEVLQADIARLPADLRARAFDHVIANPPYYLPARRSAAADAGRETALAEDLPLAGWIDAGVRRLRPGGRLTLIQRADRLADLLAGCDGRLGDLRLLPIAPREGRPAELVILRARKGARGASRLLAPLVLHEGARHERDGDSYREAIVRVLRGGGELPVDWY
jgi:tRNA1(Val) A37 N6-methylase TrmN6